MARLGAYLVILSVSTALLAIGISVYALVTPYRELSLIRRGNSAAAYSLGGGALGLMVAVASAAANSAGVRGMLAWAAIALVVQLGLHGITGLALSDQNEAVAANRVGAGIFLGAVSLAVGLVNAACLA